MAEAKRRRSGPERATSRPFPDESLAHTRTVDEVWPVTGAITPKKTHVDARTIAMVAWSVTMTVAGQLTLRHAMASLGGAPFVEVVSGAVREPLVWAGAVMYLLSTVTWLVVLSRIDLSLAYPLGSMNYLLVVTMSAVLLDERVTWLRAAGLALILVGILVVARSESRLRRVEEPLP